MQDQVIQVDNGYAWAMGFPVAPKQPRCENARDCAGFLIAEMVAAGDHVAEDHMHAGWWD